MPTYDVKRELKDLYAPRNRDWGFVEAPEQQFLAIDGRETRIPLLNTPTRWPRCMPRPTR